MRMIAVVMFMLFSASVYGADRPNGCPPKYCACAIQLKLFGRIIPKLNLAWNWTVEFPRAFPAPGMVAARSGHAMLLLEPRKGKEWLVYDPNSGNGLTRVHVRSIAGFVIVNPSRQI